MNVVVLPQDDVKITSFIKNGMGLGKDHLKAVIDADFNRKRLASYEDGIEKTWTERLKGQETLYNELKFRYHSVEAIDDGDKIKLNFGITSYKSFIGTNLVNDAQKIELLQKRGAEDHGTENAYFALPLGVGGLLRTADNHFVYMRRSNFCAEGQGLVDRPGGHPEPKVLLDKYDESDHKKLYGCESSDVLDELFESIKKEIRDEINIPMELTGEPLLMGFAQVVSQALRPSAEFYVRCSLTAEKVLECYKKGDQAEKFESLHLIIYSEQELLEAADTRNNVWKGFGPAAKAAITMYQSLDTTKRHQ